MGMMTTAQVWKQIWGEQYYIIESAKAVYDWSVLSDILGDSVSISDAKVKLYEKHKKIWHT